MSETEESRQDEEGEHPELDRGYERDEGGHIPDKQERDDEYHGPDPGKDEAGDADDEDQGV